MHWQYLQKNVLTCTFISPHAKLIPPRDPPVRIVRAICRQRVSPPLHLPGISFSRHCWIGQKNVVGDNLLFPAKKMPFLAQIHTKL